MAFSLKQITKMDEQQVEEAYQAIDMHENRKEFRQLAARREELFQIRLVKLQRFDQLKDLFYKDLEERTYGQRYGSEDDHIELVLLGETYGWDIPAEAL